MGVQLALPRPIWRYIGAGAAQVSDAKPRALSCLVRWPDQTDLVTVHTLSQVFNHGACDGHPADRAAS